MSDMRKLIIGSNEQKQRLDKFLFTIIALCLLADVRRKKPTESVVVDISVFSAGQGRRQSTYLAGSRWPYPGFRNRHIPSYSLRNSSENLFGLARAVIDGSLHPYTLGLIDSIPDLNLNDERIEVLYSDILELGKIFKLEKNARELVKKIKKELSEIEKKVPKQKKKVKQA